MEDNRLSGGLETDGTDVKGGDCVTLKEILGEIKTPSPQTSDRLNKFSKLKKGSLSSNHNLKPELRQVKFIFISAFSLA